MPTPDLLILEVVCNKDIYLKCPYLIKCRHGTNIVKSDVDVDLSESDNWVIRHGAEAQIVLSFHFFPP